MRRVSKAICVALSLSMLVNLAGFDVLASGVDSQATGTEADGNTVADPTDTLEGATSNGDQTENSTEQKDPTNSDENSSTNGGGSDNVNPDDKDTTDSDQTPADPDAKPDEPADTDKPAEPQPFEDLKAALAADAKDQLEISWTVKEDVKYALEVKAEGEEEPVFNEKDLISGKERVTVTPGKKYYITITDDAEETPNTKTIPAILLSAPVLKTPVVDGNSVTLTWDAVEGADSYEVTCGGKTEKVTDTTYTAKDLTGTVKFEIKAVCTLTEEKEGVSYSYEYESLSSSVDATIEEEEKPEKPAKVTGLTGIDGNESAILTWSKAEGAKTYVVYRYNSSKSKWEAVKTGLKKLTYTDKGLSQGKSYKYRVAAVNEGGTGERSDSFKISVKKTPEGKVRSIGYKATVKSRAPLFTSKSSSKRVRYLNAGTNVTTTDYGKGRYQIKLSDGKNYWLSKDRLTFKASIWTTKDYSTKVKEDYVNKRGFKSPTKYLIWISQYTQRVIIYEGSKGKWKMIRNCRCATGTHLHMTPKGVHKITYKEKGWFYKTTYEKPIVHFQSQNSFHSRIKNYKGGYADATIGRPKSKGCVRLYDEDINFIYKECPKGTTVVSL